MEGHVAPGMEVIVLGLVEGGVLRMRHAIANTIHWFV